MTLKGKRNVRIQSFQCENGHSFQDKPHRGFDDGFIEFVVFLYLQCLSLNTTVTIVRAFYLNDILSKGQVLSLLETVADKLPSIHQLDAIYCPKRSGYLAFDGVWFQYGIEQIVLLVCFDPETFDIVSAIWSPDETEKAYEQVMTEAVNKIGATNIKGVYADGDRGFLSALKRLLPTVPFQLCVFHKELRMGQNIPVKSVKVSK